MSVFHWFSSFYDQERIACSRCSLKRVTVSNLLMSLMIKERQERFAIFHKQITLSLSHSQKNERFARKTDERIPNQNFRYCRDIRSLHENDFVMHLLESYSPMCAMVSTVGRTSRSQTTTVLLLLKAFVHS